MDGPALEKPTAGRPPTVMRRPTSPTLGTPAGMIALQRSIGNRAVWRLANGSFFPADVRAGRVPTVQRFVLDGGAALARFRAVLNSTSIKQVATGDVDNKTREIEWRKYAAFKTPFVRFEQSYETFIKGSLADKLSDVELGNNPGAGARQIEAVLRGLRGLLVEMEEPYADIAELQDAIASVDRDIAAVRRVPGGGFSPKDTWEDAMRAVDAATRFEGLGEAWDPRRGLREPVSKRDSEAQNRPLPPSPPPAPPPPSRRVNKAPGWDTRWTPGRPKKPA
jgi:hypothetical protein